MVVGGFSVAFVVACDSGWEIGAVDSANLVSTSTTGVSMMMVPGWPPEGVTAVMVIGRSILPGPGYGLYTVTYGLLSPVGTVTGPVWVAVFAFGLGVSMITVPGWPDTGAWV
jgi:hypothetical protein